MHRILLELHKDHIHLSKLLELLQKQVDALASGDAFDMFLMIDITDYIHNYVDKVHHPKEDMIYKVFQTYSTPAVEASAMAETLLGDHKNLPLTTIEFRATLETIANTDSAVNRKDLSDEIKGFIQTQMAHMNMEEETFFPLLDATLNDDDWATLQDSLPPVNDPLFGDHVLESYQELSGQIKGL